MTEAWQKRSGRKIHAGGAGRHQGKSKVCSPRGRWVQGRFKQSL